MGSALFSLRLDRAASLPDSHWRGLSPPQGVRMVWGGTRPAPTMLLAIKRANDSNAA